jgi:hypothetical protein
MKFRAPLALLCFVLLFTMAKHALPLSALGHDGKQKAVKPKIGFTAAELIALVPTPRSEDVASPKALVLALHDSISGPMGPFKWDRFRSLPSDGYHRRSRFGAGRKTTHRSPTSQRVDSICAGPAPKSLRTRNRIQDPYRTVQQHRHCFL